MTMIYIILAIEDNKVVECLVKTDQTLGRKEFNKMGAKYGPGKVFMLTRMLDNSMVL